MYIALGTTAGIWNSGQLGVLGIQLRSFGLAASTSTEPPCCPFEKLVYIQLCRAMVFLMTYNPCPFSLTLDLMKAPIKLECKPKLQKANEARAHWHVPFKVSLVQGLCPWGFFFITTSAWRFSCSDFRVHSPECFLKPCKMKIFGFHKLPWGRCGGWIWARGEGLQACNSRSLGDWCRKFKAYLRNLRDPVFKIRGPGIEFGRKSACPSMRTYA